MRKRARKSNILEKIKHIEVKKDDFKPKRSYKKITTFGILVAIFFLVLFFNSYFNYTSGIAFNEKGTTLGTRFYLAGPDPYYNMRTCEETLRLGYYPYISPNSYDPLLNYPVGLRGTRPPLFNMIAVSSAQVLQNFMTQTDALGWSMLFLPAIYGALLIFPIYGIGAELFNRRVGLIAAFFVAIIPVHIGSGHGSALSLFDHDSFVQLLFAVTFYLTIKTIKEQSSVKSILYASLGGLFVGATYLAWTSSQLLFMMLLVYLVFQICFNIFKSHHSIQLPAKFVILYLVAFLVAFPYMMLRHDYTGFPLITLIVSMGIFIAYYILEKYKTPWILSLPALFTGGGIFLLILYLISIGIIGVQGAIRTLAITVFGEGIYGSKISQTVAEAHTFGISNSVMSIGPVLYWLGLVGFVLFCIITYKQKWKPENFFYIIIFIIDLILVSQSGRFVNDQIPTFTVFAAFVTLIIVDKINFKKMFKDIKTMGGLRGIRKGVHAFQVLSIVFLMFGLLLPNVFLTFDAAVPPGSKEQIFGKGHQGAFGTSLYQEYYWSDAYYWLSQQDTEIVNDSDKPAFISWWDYGFFEVAIGKHPAVAENYQDGIPPASNLHTATTEQEAVAVFIIRLIEGTKKSNDAKASVPGSVKFTFSGYLDENNTKTIIQYLEDPTTCPSYNQLIDPEYGNTVMRIQDFNAMYRDCINLLTSNLDDEELTNLYIDMQKATGFSIRYYGVEQYDTHIFNVFSFLSDKSTYGFQCGNVVPEEDRYMKTIYTDLQTGKEYNRSQVENLSPSLLQKMQLEPSTILKDEYFNTMFYKVYYGIYNGNGQPTDNRMPTFFLKHFIPVFISPYVIITKYYPCTIISGQALFKSQPYSNFFVIVRDRFGIPHDYTITDSNGNFTILAPAGNLTIDLTSESQSIQSQNLTVSELQADRLEPFNNTILFEVQPASFNYTIYSNQTGLKFSFKDELQNIQYNESISSFNQTFDYANLTPTNYQISFTNSTGNYVYNTTIFLKPGINEFNVTIP